VEHCVQMGRIKFNQVVEYAICNINCQPFG
jgi:hypothetical protein